MKGIGHLLRTSVFLLTMALTGTAPLAMAAEPGAMTEFEEQLQTLSPDQLAELQRRVAAYKIQGDTKSMTVQEVRAEYVRFIEKTVAEMSGQKA